MVMFYADEQFPRDITVCLRSLGYDILTVHEAGDRIHQAAI